MWSFQVKINNFNLITKILTNVIKKLTFLTYLV